MDRGVLHKSAPLVGEMGEGHGWWSVNNLRPPFEHNPHLFLSSTASSFHSLSFSPLLLSNHYPLPATTTPWHDSNNSAQGQLPEEPWSQLLLLQSSSGGLDNGEERYNQAGSLMHERRIENWAGQASEGDGISKQDGYGGSCYIYNASSQGSTGEEIQVPRPSPWNPHPHHTFQASSPRSSITSTTHGSAIMEFSNNSSSCERISTASGAALKKARIQDPSPAQPTVKVRKEKLGDRITALHQLVSPFGKTDTASVLLEAIGYIRFLHGQIEALSSPYLGRSSAGGSGGGCANSKQQQELQGEAMSVQGEKNCIFPEDPGQLLHENAVRKRVHPDQDGGEEAKKDLRGRGLCLVPVSYTLHVGSDAGAAGYWAPGFGIEFGR